MAIVFRLVSAAILSILPIFLAVGQPLASPAAQGFHSHARLLSGGKEEDGWLAGVEINLDQGFKTYWRSPGESGLPPRFDWSGSENVANVEIRWPAPSRHEDAAGVAYVYSHKVILPVVVKPAAADKPVKLALSMDYGICKDICIPAHAEMDATLSEEGPDRSAIEEALARVPRSQALGDKDDLSIVSVQPTNGEKPTFSVTVRAPAGTAPALFAEGPENWYLSTSAVTDTNHFSITVEEKPKEASGPVPLRLTLVAGDRAIETDISLEANGLLP